MDLSQNELSVLNPVWFEELESLETLNLGSNKIAELPANLFVTMENLKILNLASNNLAKINSDSFGTHLKLKSVNFGNNKINAIDKEFLENVAVEKLNLENNLCYAKKVTDSKKMKDELNRCFENYKPRKIQDKSLRSVWFF